MLMFTLAISCWTTSLPWFMDLTFQVPMQYCSLQHQTLLPSPVTSITGCCCFGSVSSFLLELFLHWSPVAYWAPNNLGSSSFSVISFCLFILFKGFSRQQYWSGLPFPSPVDHILSELSTMTHLFWVAPHRMAHSFNELDKSWTCGILSWLLAAPALCSCCSYINPTNIPSLGTWYTLCFGDNFALACWGFPDFGIWKSQS